MKTTYFKSGAFALAAALMCVATISCDDDIMLNSSIDESAYDGIHENTVVLQDAATARKTVEFEFSEGSYRTDLNVQLTQAVSAQTTLRLTVDENYLTQYNQLFGTAYKALGAGQVRFANDGTAVIEAGARSATVAMTVTAAADMTLGDIYAVPVTVTSESDGITIKETASHCLYLVTAQNELPTCHKGEELPKGFLYFEVNDVNPLNALACELEDGRLIWDVVVLFAANINHHAEEDRPYIQCNPNVQFLLDNNETYLQPLRKRGIKVLLGILGNHDQAGVAQLSEKGAKIFAAEVAHYCEAYNLDGVNYDDEYSTYPDTSHPCYAQPGGAAAARLCYETKQAMPDKLVTVFSYGYMSLYSMSSVIDDTDIARWCDVAVANYGGTTAPAGEMTMKACSGCSTEFNLGGGSSLTASRANTLLSEGYGWFMGFALNPEKGFISQLNRISGVETLYGSPLKTPTVYYKKNDPTPYPYTDTY